MAMSKVLIVLQKLAGDDKLYQRICIVKIFGKVVISGVYIGRHSLFSLLACIFYLKARGKAIHCNIMPKFARFLGSMYINKIRVCNYLYEIII